MKVRRRRNLLIESPASATGDIAFNLIVFFLVCASVQPDSGRIQNLPSSEEIEDKQEQLENIKVEIHRTLARINGEPTTNKNVPIKMKSLLSGKVRPDEKIVIVKSQDDVPYSQWLAITTSIEDAGGVITLQIEEEREVQLP